MMHLRENQDNIYLIIPNYIVNYLIHDQFNFYHNFSDNLDVIPTRIPLILRIYVGLRPLNRLKLQQ